MRKTRALLGFILVIVLYNMLLQNGIAQTSDSEFQKSATVSGSKSIDNLTNSSLINVSYTVTATAIPSGGGTTTGSGTYASCSIASVIATPNTGWSFVNWTISGSPVSSDSAYSFIVTANVDLAANFLPDQVTVTTNSNPAAGGTTTGAGTYNYGNQVTVTAIAGIGWNFIDWTETGNTVSTDSAYTFTATGNTTLVANFVTEQYNVITLSNPAAGGSTNGGGTYNYGDQATVSATPNASWVFLNWTENGNVASTSPQYTFTVTAGRTLTANFTQLPTYLITATAFPQAGGSTSGGGNYLSDDTAVVTAIPNTGYHFISWTENGNVITTDSVYSFIVTGNRNLTANFELQELNIFTLPVPAEGGSTLGDGTYTYGTTIIVTATANSGWEFDHWEENGAVVSTDVSYTFVVTANRTLSAIFYQQGAQYLITASANPAEGGTISGAGTYTAGSEVTLTAAVNPGWEFVNWTEDGTEVATDPVYTFTVVSDRDLTANFIQQFLITATASPLYAGYTTGSGEYLSGEEVTLKAVADLGWEFDRWTENGVQVSDTSIYTFIATGNLALMAEFVPVAGVHQQENCGIKVFPNPVSNRLYIAWDLQKAISFDEVILLNTLSKVVYHEPVNENSGLISISVRNLEPGLYYVILRSRSETLFGSKVIIQK